MFDPWRRRFLLAAPGLGLGWRGVAADGPARMGQPRRIDNGDKPMETTIQNDVVLECRPQFEAERLTIGYSVSSRAAKDIYVLDVLPSYDTQAKKLIAVYEGYYLCSRAGGVALVLKGIPPLPVDRQVTVRMIPLGTKLISGAKIERTLELALPLKEHSPYYIPLKPEEYDITEVSTVAFAVQFVRSTVQGFAAEPAPHGPDLFRVKSQDIVAHAETLRAQFSAPAVKLWRRKDWFTRI
jgi:hypothetical protein